jgi:hypothetical protein
MSSKKNTFIKSRLLLVVILIVVMTVGAGCSSGDPVPPNSNFGVLVSGQFSNNDHIAEIDYDPTLTVEQYGAFTIADASTLNPIEDNLYKKDKDGNLLYDELIVGRVIKFNSDWVALCNDADESVFESVEAGSDAEGKIAALADGAKVAYHHLTIGQIMQGGKNEFVLLVKENYTLAADGALTPIDSVYVYTLSTKGKSMLITDFEKI